MRLLDLFCCTGGAGMGYHRAGFEVVGVDIQPQPHYPFEFCQADAFSVLTQLCTGARWRGYLLTDLDAIHASPPCQEYSRVSGRALNGKRREYPDLIQPTRDALQATDLPYVMENVEGSPLRGGCIILCGSAFGLNVRRHRIFESNVALLSPGCFHARQKPRFRSLDSRKPGRMACVVGVHGHLNYHGEDALRREAMGIDWMTMKELTQAIPPAYTEYIGKQLVAVLERRQSDLTLKGQSQ